MLFGRRKKNQGQITRRKTMTQNLMDYVTAGIIPINIQRMLLNWKVNCRTRRRKTRCCAADCPPTAFKVPPSAILHIRFTISFGFSLIFADFCWFLLIFARISFWDCWHPSWDLLMTLGDFLFLFFFCLFWGSVRSEWRRPWCYLSCWLFYCCSFWLVW